MFVSKTVLENEPQLVRKIYDKSKEYENVTDLTLGDPDIPTPQEIKDAACRALAEYSAAPEPGVRRMRATIPVSQSQCSGQ